MFCALTVLPLIVLLDSKKLLSWRDLLNFPEVMRKTANRFSWQQQDSSGKLVGIQCQFIAECCILVRVPRAPCKMCSLHT